MSKTIIKIATYTCDVCGYAQDFEPTQENMDKHFNNNNNFNGSGLEENDCPSCVLGKNKERKVKHNKLKKETSQNKKTAIKIMGEEEIDDLMVYDGEFIPRQAVEDIDRFKTEKHEELENEKEFKLAMKEGRNPDYSKPKTQIKLPKRRELTAKEKSDKKKEIRDAIKYWKEREDK